MDEKKYTKVVSWMVMIIITLLVVNIVFGICLAKGKIASWKEQQDNTISTDTVYIEKVDQDTLSNWEMFTLALMKVESDYNPEAVSSVGAKGYFQMTPIYVAEVNRVHKTTYTFEQVTDFDTAYEIFDLMQKAHNPNYNMDKALTLHNGDHLWYRKRVYNAMNRIRTYEDMRKKVKNI